MPDEADRKFLRDWAREEFHRNKNVTHEVHSCCFFTFVLPGPLKVIVSSDQKLDIGKRK